MLSFVSKGIPFRLLSQKRIIQNAQPFHYCAKPRQSGKTQPESFANINPKNELYEQTEKAQKLQSEISDLLGRHAKREAEEKARSYGSFFKDVFRTSKPELVNIATSLVCVLLAFQVMVQRKLAKKWKDEEQRFKQEVQQLNEAVKYIQEDSFSNYVAERCTSSLSEIKKSSADENRHGLFGFWRERKANDLPIIKDVIRTVFAEEISEWAENMCKDESKKGEKELKRLQSITADVVVNSRSKELSFPDDAKQLESVFEAISENDELKDNGTSAKVVRKRKFMM